MCGDGPMKIRVQLDELERAEERATAQRDGRRVVECWRVGEAPAAGRAAAAALSQRGA